MENNISWSKVYLGIGLLMASVVGIAPVPAQSPVEEGTMSHKISGTFKVKLQPSEDRGPAEDPKLGGMSIDKKYSGVLDAVGKGQMLTAMTARKDSMAYVAIEKVIGTLDGRSGSFVLQHTGVMNAGKQELSITVVPDSGTEGLTGITGKMGIRIEDGGAHFYDFEYRLPPENETMP